MKWCKISKCTEQFTVNPWKNSAAPKYRGRPYVRVTAIAAYASMDGIAIHANSVITHL